MVQEDTCSTTEAIDCERNESVTSGSSYPAVKFSAARRAFQRAVGEKGPDGSLTLLAFRRARFPARPNRRFKALFPRGRYLHELYALDIALDKEALRNCRSSVRPLPLRMTGAP